MINLISPDCQAEPSAASSRGFSFQRISQGKTRHLPYLRSCYFYHRDIRGFLWFHLMSGSIIVQKSTSSYWSRLVSSYLAQDSSDASNDDYSSDKSEELTRDVKHQLPPTSLPVSQPLRLGDLEADHGNRSLACVHGFERCWGLF